MELMQYLIYTWLEYSCKHILLSVHMAQNTHVQSLHICKQKFSLGLHQVQKLKKMRME